MQHSMNARLTRSVGLSINGPLSYLCIVTGYIDTGQLEYLILYSQTKKCTTFMPLCIFFKWHCQMPFGQYRVKFFLNILGKLIFLRYYEINFPKIL